MTMMDERSADLIERITRLETKMDAVERANLDVRGNLGKIEDNLETLMRKIERYESKLGGVFLAATAIIAFFKLLGETGWQWLKTNLS